MQLTPYHAKYYAFELSKRASSNSIEKLAASLSGAQVDLNPHQINAALFAFRSPLSKGAILADEVGLRQDHRGGYHPLSAMGRAQRDFSSSSLQPCASSGTRSCWRSFPALLDFRDEILQRGDKEGEPEPLQPAGDRHLFYPLPPTRTPTYGKVDWDHRRHR